MTKTDILEMRKRFSDITYQAVILRIEMPDGSVETIVNHNVDAKIEYICDAYTEELFNKNNSKIKIVGFLITDGNTLESFGNTVEYIQSRLKMTRLGWEDEEYIYFVPDDKPCIIKRKSDGSEELYIPSQEDILAKDWIECKFKEYIKSRKTSLVERI